MNAAQFPPVHSSALSPGSPVRTRLVSPVSRGSSVSGRCSHPSVSSVGPAHRRVWGRHGGADPPPLPSAGTGGLSSFNGKFHTHTHTRSDSFQVVKTNRVTSDSSERQRNENVPMEKPSSNYIQPWPGDKLVRRCSSGSLENLDFQNIFTSRWMFSGFPVRELCPVWNTNKKYQKQGVTVTVWPLWNPSVGESSPAETTVRFPWFWWPLFLLSWQIFLECFARLESTIYKLEIS